MDIPSKFGRRCPRLLDPILNLIEVRPCLVASIAHLFVSFRPNLVELGQHAVGSNPTLVEFRPHKVKFNPELVALMPRVVEFIPNLVELSSDVVEPAHIGQGSTQLWSNNRPRSPKSGCI